jgi:PIN domain nuclease of toxin-antitoxin system
MLNDIGMLDIAINHSLFVATLPFHHRDAFDRMSIAQSRTESLPLIRADSAFDSYGVARVW